jgi:hypothetical protein
MHEKHGERIYIFFVFILFIGFLLACNFSSQTIQNNDVDNETKDYSPTMSATSSSILLLDQEIINKISSELAYNQTEIELNPKHFKYLENPVGEGIFIYEPETRFFGVERFFIWIYLNDNLYVLNGATRNVTPNIPVARDVPSEIWGLTNISPYSATDLIGFIFEGKELNP